MRIMESTYDELQAAVSDAWAAVAAVPKNEAVLAGARWGATRADGRLVRLAVSVLPTVDAVRLGCWGLFHQTIEAVCFNGRRLGFVAAAGECPVRVDRWGMDGHGRSLGGPWHLDTVKELGIQRCILRLVIHVDEQA